MASRVQKTGITGGVNLGKSFSGFFELKLHCFDVVFLFLKHSFHLVCLDVCTHIFGSVGFSAALCKHWAMSWLCYQECHIKNECVNMNKLRRIHRNG